MKIVYGFDDKKIIETIEQELTNKRCAYESIICHTKLDVYKCAYEMNDIDYIILFENVNDETPWTALEIIKLVDFRDIEVIPIIRDKHANNSEYLKLLYSSGIYNALIGKVNFKEIVGLIKKPRNKKEAKKYYNIDKCILNLKDVTGRELEDVLGYLSRGFSEENIALRFDNACAEFNDEQVENLLQKVNVDIKKACKKSYRYKAIIGKKNDELIEYEGIGNNNDIHDVDILYGFDSDEAISYLESMLEREGYTIKSSRVKYNKEGIRNCVLKEDINTVVVIENLERRGGYSVDEIVALHEMGSINLIMLLDRNKKANEYINQLYCEGITNALIGDNSAKEVISLIMKKRNRRRAREHYGLNLGNSCNNFICSKHKDSVYVYWDKGIGELEERYEFTKKLLNEEQIKEVIEGIPDDLRQKMEEANVLKVKNRKRKDVSVKQKKMFAIMGVCILVISIICFGGYVAYGKIKANKRVKEKNNQILVESTTILEKSTGFVYSPIEETTAKEMEPTIQAITETITEVVQETTKRKKKITSHKQTITYHKGEQTSKMITPEETLPKSAAQRQTEPRVKTLGAYSESNALSSSKVSIVRNSILSILKGSSNGEKTNLARYMSARGLSNATATYKSLTNGSKSFSVKVASTNIESDSSENMLKAANKLVSKIGDVSGSYGLGVSSFRQSVGYRIYVVVVY